MKRSVLIIFVLLSFFFWSCKKDVPVPDLQIQNSEPSGQSYIEIDSVGNSKVTVKILHPSLSISNPGIVTNSIDINSDGTFDFELIGYNEAWCGQTDYDVRLRIRTLNAQSFVLVDSVFHIIHYSEPSYSITLIETRDSLFGKPLNLYDTIRRTARFRQGNFFLSADYRVVCSNPVSAIWHDNVWYNKPYGFIGVKNKNNLGWINIGYYSLFGYAIAK